MPSTLDVWLFNYRVGTLRLTEGRLSFCYLVTWINNTNPTALSSSLPLQSEIFDDYQLRPFFGKLLPKGNMRKPTCQAISNFNTKRICTIGSTRR